MHVSTLTLLIFLAASVEVAGETDRGLSVVDVERIIGLDGHDHYITVLETLDRRGYTIVEVSSTWLNRLRIWAENNVHRREIVVSRTNGRILRDVILETYHTSTSEVEIIPVAPLEELLQNHPGGIRIVPNP
ncbi:hypothetical protein LY39_03564 [Roseinatronobacter bogoriensis subsp. barguzinensis]|uniref:Uncharacterized protein n=1 Tax=Roseinatronobacter bogoriensis subsp. barguzinensis TaxID=441209 RepID=A0A2K8KEG6_9RHOB|nr:hypothetical protein BG454_00755 [Rhodobaca barguzinensis]MBB4209717.1 hypothetical protein [Rhodobaca bogoriensis DSM 18756]TDW33731.1 hypothetical protein LY39_03564 [Rhodobaca barguzinensis]TDY66202.1 hypothetical protein EV660_11355 [Rhodobaca bogoriensis DSM 18756]